MFLDTFMAYYSTKANKTNEIIKTPTAFEATFSNYVPNHYILV